MKDKLSKRLRRKMTRLTSPVLQQDIFFLHVPKCGGTSLVNSIADHYKSSHAKQRKIIGHLNSHAGLVTSNLHGHNPFVFNRK